MRAIVQLSRLLVGALFIFSGLIKANDPVGFSIKLEDYFLVFAETLPVFGADWVMGTTLVLAWSICVVEVALGIALLLGLWRKTVAWSLLLMMVFFTWLTGYSAITGSVTDCGCFGDAIPLTPWESFYKDLILMVLIGFIWRDVFIGPKAIRPLLPGGLAVPLFILGSAFTGWVGLHAIQHLPFRDFRPYRVGNNIAEGMTLPPDAREEIVELTWTYRNKASGEVVEFVDELPADLAAWEFLDRTEKVVQKGDEPPIHDFMLVDADDRDRTDAILSLDDVYCFVISPDLGHTHRDHWDAAVALANAAEAEGIHTFGLVGNGRDAIEAFRHEAQAAFPFFSVDQKTLKTILRTDPGLVILRRGTILAKYAGMDIPTFAEAKARYFPDREPGPLASLDPEPFAEGRNLAGDYAGGAADMSGFALYTAGGDPVTDSLLALPAQHWVLVAEVAEVTPETWPGIRAAITALDSAGTAYTVITGSAEEDLLPMRAASGAAFPYAFADPDWLAELGGPNARVLALREGVVARAFAGQAIDGFSLP
jgi:uncharacterized membrane protein YphA (DoxX/SURF4 family)